MRAHSLIFLSLVAVDGAQASIPAAPAVIPLDAAAGRVLAGAAVACVGPPASAGAGSAPVFAVAGKGVAALLGRGFVARSCPAAQDDANSYAQEICRFSWDTPLTLQERFRKTYGISPSELCTLIRNSDP